MLQSLYDAIRSRCPAFFEQTACALRYFYYLRFSLLVWLFPLILIKANSPKVARSLVSGIVTPSNTTQYLCVAFFLVALSQVALIVARIVLINGEARFGDPPPHFLTWLLANSEGRYEFLAQVGVQLNTLITFCYFYVNGVAEGVGPRTILEGLVAGCLLSIPFWFVISALYYLSYRPAQPSVPRADGKPTARSIVAPRSVLLMSPVAARPGHAARRRFGDVLEDAVPMVHLNWIRHCFPVNGYRVVPAGDLYEGHFLSIIALVFFYSLYWILFPLTAPVPVEGWAHLALALLFAGAALLILFVVSARPTQKGDASALLLWKALLSALILGFAVSIPVLYARFDSERFPILALVLIFVISAAWGLSAIAFFADRFRVPVLTVVLLVTAVPRILHWDNGREEHFLSTARTSVSTTLPTPADVLSSRLAAQPGQPLVIVTSTGGGIHAAAWTAAVLRQLESQFAKNPQLGTFHGHVLLLSTVSGGSSGLYTYLRELDPRTNDGRSDWSRMVLSAQCSSLESVGWGLIYYDINKAFVPFLPYFVRPSQGIDDLEDSPLGKDRTWALRKAFARNLHDPYCESQRLAGGRIRHTELQAATQHGTINENDLTLREFNALEPGMPAFSMNSTVVESGERFLLANYRIPYDLVSTQGDYRARSFLATYSSSAQPADLPLATAAQMSATFPLVSSAARVPLALDNSAAAVHFVDGGYFDNDGTATAIEFLRYAFAGIAAQPAAQPATPAGKPALAANKDQSQPAPVRILIVEIRNSGDIAPSVPESNPDHSDSTALSNLLGQATAPLDAFWSAGHESVTARNRGALALLQSTLAGQAIIRRIVIDDQHAEEKTKTDPLNWSLTPRQQQEVWGSAYKARDCYQKVEALLLASQSDWQTSASSQIPCNAFGPPQSSPPSSSTSSAH